MFFLQEPVHMGIFDQVIDEDSACEDMSEEEGDNDGAAQERSFFSEHLLSKLSPRMTNFIVRFFSGCSLILGFVFLISLGPIGLIALVRLTFVLLYYLNHLFRLLLSLC